MEATELIIGKRYWLDRMKDVSGVFIGNGYYFNDIKGTNHYYRITDGIIGFITSSCFYEID